MGENRHLPESELDIMLVVQCLPQPFWRGWSARSRPVPLHSYLKRLEEKGFLSCKKTGKVNTYTAMVAREDYQRSEGERKKLYGSSISRFAAALYDGKGWNRRSWRTGTVDRLSHDGAGGAGGLGLPRHLPAPAPAAGAERRHPQALPGRGCYLLWLVLALRLLIPLPVPVPVGTALSQVVPAPAAEETLVSLPGISGPASVRGPQAGGAGGAAELTEALSWLWAAGGRSSSSAWRAGGYLRPEERS